MITSDGRWLVDSVEAERSERSQRRPETTPPPRAPAPEPAPDPDPDPGDPSEEEETDEAVSGNCYVGGCSGQVCSDRPPGDMVTTCEWRAEYACYQDATCERQADGECGWTETSELQECLATAEDGPR